MGPHQDAECRQGAKLGVRGLVGRRLTGRSWIASRCAEQAKGLINQGGHFLDVGVGTRAWLGGE